MKRIFSLIIIGIVLGFSLPNTVVAQKTEAKKKVEQMKEESKAMSDAMHARMDSINAVHKQQMAEYEAQNKKTQKIIWIVVAFGLLYAAFFLYQKYKNLGMTLFRIFTGNYRTKGDLSTPESKKILTGAIYAEQQGAYLNTLKADVGDKLYTILGEWWGINGADSAIETLDYLKNKAFTYYFPTVYKASQAGSDEERKSIILAAMTNQEDAEKAYSQTLNLLESVDVFKKTKLIREEEEIEKSGVVGWDVGRLVFIARLCYDAKYITEQEAWEYIDAAYEQAQSAFQSWEELAKSYVIGRFVWKGKDADDGVQAIAENLVNKPNSPWKQVAWK
jgi:hypothetical protein